MKLSIEEYFSDTLIRVKEHRKQIMSIAKEAVWHDVNHNRNLHKMFKELYDLIPTEGHIGYASQNMTTATAKVDEITSYLLRNNFRLEKEYKTFKNALKEHDNGIQAAVHAHKIRNVDDHFITEKAVANLYRRLGNKIIQRASTFKRADDRGVKRAAKQKRYGNKKLLFLLEESARLNALYEQECIDIFNEYLEKLEEANMKICRRKWKCRHY